MIWFLGGIAAAVTCWIGGCGLFFYALYRASRRIDREEELESLWVACGGPDLERLWQTEKAL